MFPNTAVRGCNTLVYWFSIPLLLIIGKGQTSKQFTGESSLSPGLKTTVLEEVVHWASVRPECDECLGELGAWRESLS